MSYLHEFDHDYQSEEDSDYDPELESISSMENEHEYESDRTTSDSESEEVEVEEERPKRKQIAVRRRLDFSTVEEEIIKPSTKKINADEILGNPANRRVLRSQLRNQSTRYEK